jgi:hypothetical protein
MSILYDRYTNILVNQNIIWYDYIMKVILFVGIVAILVHICSLLIKLSN